MKDQAIVYGVQITRKDGSKFLALGPKGSIHVLFYWHRDAMNFCKNLREDVCGTVKVEVDLTVTWEAK